MPDRQEKDWRSLPDAVSSSSKRDGVKPRLVTPLYGPVRKSFSGTTWFLADAMMNDGVLDGVFTLYNGSRNIPLQVRGSLWKILKILRGSKSGGYKFAPEFFDRLFAMYGERLRNTTLINNTQIYGPFFAREHQKLGISPTFYIDGTLSEYFDSYGAVEQQGIGKDTIRRAIDMERESYAFADKIIAMSSKTARVLQELYDVPQRKIAVAVPGANMADPLVPLPSDHKGWVGDEFTLGFVGLFPFRKGLDKLARAVEILRQRSMPIRLRVIGRCPPEIVRMDGVEYLGMIDKSQDMQKFISELRQIDLGCQLSRAELLGIALLEFMRLGIPVIATDVGGVPDVLSNGGGILLSPDVSAEELAEELSDLVTSSDRYQRLRAQAQSLATWASWKRAGREIDQHLQDVGL